MVVNGSGHHHPQQEQRVSTYTTCADPDGHRSRWLWQPIRHGQQFICPLCPAAWKVTTLKP